ncbi:tRNA(Glu)-specific nuclease WapA precursor [Symmachiella macrocystis]|uniref:tRNA(Glu)-specific nuclease WapA n=1 Tax=Symmachiella macrocystis TaxID=2527985 RepID=A0A5C6B976_9PLAN|nr:RHS repeat-associated core domain-containing protein [Symmachiella macrocystis]TWU08633.1 tRNA(Glu)-specific nuclease WapA precursor [Symmachiella macrocystis]
MQHYVDTAYGRAIGFVEAAALTTRLYSGEAFDSRVGLQYLRARWYDPNSGRFNRLDPFSGNLRDPQSLHKYLYTHGDPVNGIDPTGMFWGGLVGLLTTFAVDVGMRAHNAVVTGGVGFEAYVAISLFDVWADSRAAVFGIDENGEPVGPYARALAGAFLFFDVLPGGKILKRLRPKYIDFHHLWDLVSNQVRQHDNVTGKGAARAFEFAEDIVEGSVESFGDGVRGADIVAKVWKPGRRESVELAREVASYNGTGNPRKLYQVITEEAAQVLEHNPNAEYQSVLIQLGKQAESVASVDYYRERAASATHDLIHLFDKPMKPNFQVIILDSAGNQIFPFH